MERIAIFAALQWECRPILRCMRQVRRRRMGAITVWSGTTPGGEVWLVKTGMGLERAHTASRTVSDAGRFSLWVSSGCAGALSTELGPGDLAVATAMIHHASGERFETNPMHREHASRIVERRGLRGTVGAVVSTAQVLATPAAKRAVAERCNAVAVEMEGASIAAVAAEHGIPFVSVRAILDTADTELDHSGRFTDPSTGAVRPLALAGYLASHPRAWSSVLALQRMMGATQSSLETFFGAFLGDPLG